MLLNWIFPKNRPKNLILQSLIWGCFAIFPTVFLLSCQSSSAEELNHVRLVWFGSEEELTAIQACLADFEKEHSGYQVTLQPVEWGKYNEKIMTMLLGRRPPDVARMSAQWCSRYQALGALADISSALRPEDLGDFVPARLASCRADRQVFALPHTSVGLMLFYNKDLLEQAGVDAPQSPESAWSWEAFSRISGQIQEKAGVKYAWGAYRGWFPFLTFLYQNGGRLLKDGAPDFAAEDNVAALRWFIEQHEKGLAPKTSWTRGGDSAETNFVRGDCAMVVTGNWRLTFFTKRIQDFDWDVTYLPQGKRRATNVGGENLVVFKTPKTEAAAALVRFLTRPEQMEKFCTSTLFLPTRQSLLDRRLPYRIRKEAMRKFALQSLDFKPQWAAEQSTPEFAMIEDRFLKQIELAVLGAQTPKESLEALNREYRSVQYE